MTLIRGLLHVPEKIFKGDFALNLSVGVTQPQQTVDSYVVTPGLGLCFRDALKFRGRSDFDVTALVTAEAIPFLPILRYSEAGMRKRAQWEDTWALQRREDAGESVGKIPVPARYANTDFQKGGYWRLLGKLDVPKERSVFYPLAGRETDRSPAAPTRGRKRKADG